MADPNPFTNTKRRPAVDGPFHAHEVGLAMRNSGILLEALRHDVTPAGLHYLLSHFDVPYVPDGNWQVEIAGRVRRPGTIALEEIKRLPSRTLRVTLECAGNGRATMRPRYPSMPWGYEAVSTAEWTGTPVRHVLERAELLDDAIEIAFLAIDRGFDRGHEHAYGRSLDRPTALGEDVLLVWAMNGAVLLPQHGYPLRLIVPGWYGMASVKWLARIEARAEPYDGFQQVKTYLYRPVPEAPTTPVTHMRVKALIVPPGVPDFYTRRRMVEAGPVDCSVGHGRVPAPRSRGSNSASTGSGTRLISIRRRASTPGAAGARCGMRRSESMSFPVVPPTPPGKPSPSRSAGIAAASATTPCSGSR